MQILNKGFRVLYATMAPASRTTNQIDPVVLHGSLESTISWLLCLAWIKCSKLWLLHFPLCISPIELTRVFPDFKFCFVQVILSLCSLLVGLSWGFISWSKTCLDFLFRLCHHSPLSNQNFAIIWGQDKSIKLKVHYRWAIKSAQINLVYPFCCHG